MKMKFPIKIISLCLAVVLCLSIFIARGSKEAPDDEAGYHLTFDGCAGVDLVQPRAVWNDDKGSDDLIFQWDYTPEGTEEYEMVMALLGGAFVQTTEGHYYTYASINKHSVHSDDAHWATFKTIEKYPYDIFSGEYEGYYVLAVTPICEANGAEVWSAPTVFEARMPMPATFTQVADQKPDFLRNYMYMYAFEMIDDNMATLKFKHIPATFRFIITNKRPTEANIKSVQISLTDDEPVASQSVSVSYSGPAFSQDTYTTITTQLGENGTTVQKDAQYTAYALALPLANKDAFNGKKLQFTIVTDTNEHLSFELDGSQIEAANRTITDYDVYNWVGGKSYTIRMSLNDVLTFEGITVEDWNDGGTINAPIATEWLNGFSESGDLVTE